MATSENTRQDHFEQFEALPPEKQLAWALSTGHALWQIMPKSSKKYAESLRNGWKKYLTRARSRAKNS